MTGHTESEFISQAFKKGVDYVYSKPVQREGLEACLLEKGYEIKK